MDKYAGMNIVEAKVTQNSHAPKRKRSAGGFIKTLLLQTAVAVCVGVALFVGKAYGGKTLRGLSEKVQESVCFDAFGAIVEWIEDD